MRQSKLFTKTRKEAPSDEVSKNAQLLIRAGFINKEMAGVYSMLPLGLKTHEKIKQIIREEMNAIGGQEILMSSLQPKEIWENTGRWDDELVDVWFKAELKAGGEVGFGWSHEEPIGEMMKNHIRSFKDLPVYVYQFQNKLRNELRAKSGIMRGREFGMKDSYSFCDGEEQHNKIYEDTIKAYERIFERFGIADRTFMTFAPGGAFTEFSHEFQTICDAGEDYIYLNKEKNIAINEEVMSEETLQKLGVKKEELKRVKTAEVGNIFNFGLQKAKDIGLFYKNEAGEKTPVWMGSYGIGTTRMMGVLAEVMSDNKGLVWPEEVSPFKIHLILLDGKDTTDARDEAERLYEDLLSRGADVLYDDREVSAGQKFADADLIGISNRFVISDKTLSAGQIEYYSRQKGTTKMITEQELIERYV